MVKNLRALRLSRGVSQQQLADVLGTTQQSINKYENHGVEPDIDALIRLADYFGTSVDELIGHVGGAGADVERPPCTREELSLLQDYRALTKDEKASIQLIIRNYRK